MLWAHRELGDLTVDASPALVLTPDATGVLDLDVRSGNLAHLTGTTIAVGRDAARSRGAPVGSTVDLTLGDGAHVTDLGFGPVVLSRDLARGHTTSGLDQELLVSTDGSAATQHRLSSFVSGRAGLALAPVRSGDLLGSPPEARINLVVLAVLLGYLLLGVANRAVVTIARRQGELAMLRLIGATPSQLRSVMRKGAALLSAAAVGAGLGLSALPLALLGTGFLGRPWPAGPGWLAPVAVAGIVALGLLTVELPTRWALRTAPLTTQE